MRPSILLGFWRVHKCRGHVVRNLEVFVRRWQAQGRTASAWDEPLAIGFLTTLITRLAQRAAGPIGPDALGSLQSELWGTLTGSPAGPLGERLVLLSTAAEPRFVEGCRRALVFAHALEAEAPALPEGLDDASVPLQPAAARRDLFDLWDSLLVDSPGL